MGARILEADYEGVDERLLPTQSGCPRRPDSRVRSDLVSLGSANVCVPLP